jgi:hypothetical protein
VSIELSRTVARGGAAGARGPARGDPGRRGNQRAPSLAGGAEIRNDIRVSTPPLSPPRPLPLAAIWGVGGVAFMLVMALARLGPVALEPIRTDALSGWQVALYGGWVVFMAYTEGYRGFQLAWSPRVVARALHVARRPRPHLVVLAPLVCMGLLHATRKRLIVSWTLTIGIVTLVILVRQLPQPWRGIVDGGVVVGLGWGLIALLWFFGRGLCGKDMPVPADVPIEYASDREAREPA